MEKSMEDMQDSFRVETDSEDEFLMVETSEKNVEDDSDKDSDKEEEEEDHGTVEEHQTEKNENDVDDENDDKNVVVEEEEDNTSEVYEDGDDDGESKHFPGNSEFLESTYSDNTSEWDSVSRGGSSNKSAADTAVWFLEEAGKQFMKAMTEIGDDVTSDEGKNAVIIEGAKLFTQLDRSLRGHYKKTSSKNVENNNETKNGNNNEKDSLWKLFENEHVVVAVQEFLNQPIVTQCVTQFAKQGKFHIDSVKGIGAEHFGDLLAALGDLIKQAPELLKAIPLTIEQLWNFFLEGEEVVHEEVVSKENEKVVSKENEESVLKEEENEVSKEQSITTIIHTHVLCDGCNTDEKREQSKKNGHLVGNYIAGNRWKSAIIEDFDLCSTCEQTGQYEENYGPFLKVTHPKKAPKQLIVLLRDTDNVPNANSNRRGRRHGGCRRRRFGGRNCNKEDDDANKEISTLNDGGSRRRGFAGRNGNNYVPTGVAVSSKNNDDDNNSVEVPTANASVCEAPALVSLVQQAAIGAVNRTLLSAALGKEQDENQEQEPIKKLVCPENGHPLIKFRPVSAYTCDVCDGRSCIDTIMYGCRECDWDICKTCADAQNFDVQKVEEKEERKKNPPAPVIARNQRPQAKFVSDISLPDGSLVERNGQIAKTWRIQNSGSTIWPDGVRLVCVGGERMEGNMNGVSIPPLQPNMFFDASVQLVAPDRPGRYVGYWRLMTPEPNQHRFGHRLWVDITVKEEEEQQQQKKKTSKVTPSTSPQEEAVDPFVKWSTELQKLADMGFCDCDKNVGLLEKHQGNMESVISALF